MNNIVLVNEKNYLSIHSYDHVDTELLMAPFTYTDKYPNGQPYKHLEILQKFNLLDTAEARTHFYCLFAPGRQYHNSLHALHVTGKLFELTDDVQPETVLAALWHDAIYFPGSKVNEEASADALLYYGKCKKAKDVRYMRIVETAAEMIKNTTVAIHMFDRAMTHDWAINLCGHGQLRELLDADLSSLASTYEKFVKTQKLIIVENNGDPDNPEHLKMCAEFLKKISLSRTHIYHTDKGRELWEEYALSNIQRLCDETGVKYEK